MLSDSREFVYLVDATGTIRYVNEAWVDFAAENGASHLDIEAVTNTSLFDYIEDRTTRQLYDVLHNRVLKTRGPVRIPFRCDSPTRRRLMEMELRMEDGLIGYHNRVLRLEERDPVPLWDPERARNGTPIRACGWCKKLPTPDGRWLEAEDAIRELDLFESADLPPISHGICPACELLVRS